MISARALPTYRSPAAALVALLAVALAAYVVIGGLVAQGRTHLLLYPALAAVFALCFVFWRQAVYVVFAVLFVEGYFRNMLNTPDVLLLKDLMLAAIYLRVLGDRIHRRSGLIPDSPINLPLAAFTAIVLAQAFNPNVASAGQAAVGVRTWLFYVPTYFVALEMFQTERDMRRFAWFVLLCAAPISGLAFHQYLSGPEAYARLGEGFESAVFVTGGAQGIIYRPNATFAWSSNFALFLALATFLCVGLMLASRGRARVLLWLLLAGLIAMNVIENQRAVLVLLPPLVLLIVALRRSAGPTLTAGLACLLGLVIVAQVASPAAFERVNGILQNQDSILNVRAETHLDYFRDALDSPIGFGTGATSIGTRHLVGGIPLFVEFSLAKVVGDLSLVGLALYLWLFLALLLSTFGLHKHAARNGLSSLASLAAAIFAFQLLVVYTGYDLAIVAVPFWLLGGAVAGITRFAVGDGAKSREVPPTRMIADTEAEESYK
jgi:hypothetical protein